MSEDGGGAGSHGRGDGARAIRDLSDFCVQWADLKPRLAPEALAQAGLDPEQREAVGWLVLLADRVCDDLGD